MHRLRANFLLPLSAIVLAACAGGGGSSSPGGTTSARLLVGSTGDPGLFSLGSELTELRLVDDSGRTTANLLPVPTTVEWVGVGSSPRWLATGSVPEGTYTAIRASFAPGSVSGVDATGARVSLAPTTTTFQAPLIATWTAGGGSPPANLLLDMDLSGSVYRNGSGGGMVLDPDAVVVLDDQRPIQNVEGTLTSASAFDHRLTIDAYGPSGVGFGSLDVFVDTTTQLWDGNGVEFLDPDAFFQSLRPGFTMLEVRGTIESTGVMSATVVRILDQGGGPVPPAVVIEGRVLHNDTGVRRFVLLIRSIASGSAVADPILEDLGSPLSIEVAYDAATRFLDHEGETESPSDLETGELVRVHFPSFDAPPFYADRVEMLEEGRTIEGTVVDVSNLPDSFDMYVDEDEEEDEEEHGNLSGLVTVDLGGADIELDFRGHPTLGADAIVTGVHVRVRGTLGVQTGPQLIHAELVSVKPGHLIDAEVSRADEVAGTFEVRDGRIVQTFGDAVTAPPLSIVLAPSARFLQDASSAAEFFDLFDELDADHVLEVKVKGIGTRTAEELEAYEVKAKVKRKR
ncbi:MAG TPA: hypothetical protein ENJ09_14715 [Planctomycetes bacterium]|nr:hypothetical protein [Planctomycetota bacterium]